MASTSAAPGAQPPSEYFFGWDLLYKTIEKTVDKKSDLIIALAHFVLIKKSNFRCLGIGEDKTITEDDIRNATELLPDGWNKDDRRYALRYVANRKLYLLLASTVNDLLIINLLDVDTKNVSNVGVTPDKLVVKTKGNITTMIPTVSEVVERYRKELVEPVFSGTTKTATTQTTRERQGRSSPLRISEPRRPIGPMHYPRIEPRPFGQFPDVGRGDLDPLGRGGPGNLLQFPSHPDFRVGIQPRFDPFGPPDPNVVPNPNPDHFQPPNFGGHDYYM